MNSQWYVFMVSFGCLLIMISFQAPVPTLTILSGVILAAFGGYKIMKKK